MRAVVLVANTRLPSQRAQALQVAQSAAAFARAGAPTTLLYAHRTSPVALPAGMDLWDYYGVPPGARPKSEALRCIDWIERVPRVLQYVPARLQETSFARSATRRVLVAHAESNVLSREIETAHALCKAKHARVFLEIHRVPGSRLRRKWLASAALAARGIVAISEGVREDLALLGIAGESVCVEHDAFEPGRFAALPTRHAARERLKLPLDVPLVVYTGGLLQWKGVDVLVEAARSLPEAYIVIAGGMDADVKRLRQKAGGLANLRIDGFQAPELVPIYLAAADVGVVPNRAKPAISPRARLRTCCAKDWSARTFAAVCNAGIRKQVRSCTVAVRRARPGARRT